jgi:hypothetical protein
MEDLRLLNETNTLIRNFVRKWEKTGDADSGVKHLLLLGFGDFVDSLMEWNARLMGFDTSVADYTMERLRWSKHSRSEQSIAQLCSTRVPVGRSTCEGTRYHLMGCIGVWRLLVVESSLVHLVFWRVLSITRRGMGLLLLLRLLPLSASASNGGEQRCNDDFMSLKSVDVSSTF